MTSIRLLGGLGNQLFQLTAGLYLERHRGLRVTFDRSWFSRQPDDDSKREFELEGLIPKSRLRAYPTRVVKAVYSARNPWLVRESDADDVLTHAPIMRRSWLEGYFQKAKYVDKVAAELTNLLQPPLATGQALTSSDDLALHVRLGDYYDNPVTREFHGLLTPAYFDRALTRVASVAQWKRIVVFTDSPAVFEREYSIHVPGPWELSETNSAWDTLGAISNCGGVVMSNSSLSWWGSFLASRRTGESAAVVYPTPWFRVQGPADRDLPRDSWSSLRREPDGDALGEAD